MKTKVILENGILTLELIPVCKHEETLIKMFNTKNITVNGEYPRINTEYSSVMSQHNSEPRDKLVLKVRELTKEESELKHKFEVFVENGLTDQS